MVTITITNFLSHKMSRCI